MSDDHKNPNGLPSWKQVVMLPISLLTVDRRLQRDLNPSKVDVIVDNFDPDQFDPIRVVRRTSGYKNTVVTDGQHRFEAAKRLGYTNIPCYLVAFKGYKWESQFFKAINTNSSSLTHRDHFKVEAGADSTSDAGQIKAILEKHNLEVGKGGSNRRINAVQPLRDSFTVLGPELFEEMVYVLSEVPEGGTKLYKYHIDALTTIFDNNTRIDITRLSDVLWGIKSGPMIVRKLTNAVGRYKSSEGGLLACIIADEYNKRLHDHNRISVPHVF